MAKFSPIGDNIPFGRHEFVDVKFEGAWVPLEIKHSLRGGAVRALPVEWRFSSPPPDAPFVFKFESAARRPDGPDFIVLTCNVANARCRLLLFTEKN